jgi:hypothetical protein
MTANYRVIRRAGRCWKLENDRGRFIPTSKYLTFSQSVSIHHLTIYLLDLFPHLV